MATAIYKGSYTSQELQQKFLTPSFENLIVYKTQQPAASSTLITKQDLVIGQANGQYTGSVLRGATGKEWDHTIWELNADPQIAQAQADIILDFSANPDYHIEKNQGKGRIQRIDIKGERQTLYDFHQEPDGGVNHLHTLTFANAIDGNKVITADPFYQTYVRRRFLEEVNSRLEKANLPVINEFQYENTSNNPNSQPGTVAKSQAAELVNGQKTLDEILESPAFKPVDKDHINISLQTEEAELAKLVERTKEQQALVQKLKQAAEVSDKYNLLVANVEAITAQKEELEKRLATKDDEIQLIKEEAINLVSQKDIEIQAQIEKQHEIAEQFEIEKGNLRLNIQNLEVEKEEKQAIINELDELNKEQQQELKTVSSELKTVQTNNNALIEALADKNSIIENEKEKNVEYVNKINELTSKYAEETKALKLKVLEQGKEITVISGENSKLKNHNQELEKGLNEIKGQVNELTNTNSSLQTSLVALQKWVDGVVEKLKTILTPEQQKKLDLDKTSQAEGKPAVKRTKKHMTPEIEAKVKEIKEKAEKNKAKTSAPKKSNDDPSPQ